jgi:hypothetical protein
MHRTEREEVLFNLVDFPLQPIEIWFSIHDGYAIYHSRKCQPKKGGFFMTEKDVAKWLVEKAVAALGPKANMGDMEKAVDQAAREARRIALEEVVLQTIAPLALECPICHTRLNVVDYRRRRTVEAVFGRIAFTRGYGFCTQCQDYVYPADVALGLQERARSSPRLQEICALTALRAPAGQAEADVYRLTGIAVGASTLHREARRQGERALALRLADEELTQSPEGIAQLAARAPTLATHPTLVIEIDAWNIRERDHWGQTKAFMKAGKDTERWHWVYTATVFRLDQRGTTASGRPVIAERGYVATRQGIDRFQRQVYAEALQRGLLDAELVLVLADGAVWIWNLVQDRFPNAKQRVDLHHVQEHLWKLAHELYGQGTLQAETWVSPYLQWLDKRQQGALDMIHSLEQLHRNLQVFSRKQREAIARELQYFQEHKGRMDYKAGKAAGQPVGSGAIESTCSQYQRRFKLAGQFWTLAGDEAFLSLATLYRNDRWSRLFPHDSR